MKLTSVFLRISLLLMTFLLGFMCCIGAIVGAGIYVYKNVSLDTLQVDTDAFIDPEAEVDLTALSIEGLIAEIQQLSAIEGSVSLDVLISRYGFIIPAEVEEYLPASVTAMPIKQLFSMEGIMEIADGVYVGQLLQFDRVEGGEIATVGWVDASGNEVVGLNAKIADYTLGQLIKGEINVDSLLNDITVADIFSMTSDETLRVYLDADDGKQLLEDKAISVWYNNDGSRAEGIVSALAKFTVMEISSEINNLQLANIGGLEEYSGVYYNVKLEEDSEGEYILLTKADGIIAELADVTVIELTSGDISDKLSDIRVGIVMGYTYDEANDIWVSDGQEATGIMAVLADKKISELENSVDEITIADAMSLTYNEAEDAYYDKDGSKVTGVMAALADKQIGELNSAVDDLKLAEVMGYTYDEETDAWFDEGGNKATGVIAALADKRIDELDGAVDELTIADVMGYTYDEETESWLDENGDKATGVTAALADKRIDELDGAVDELTIAEVMGYTYDEEYECWLDEEGNEVSGVTAALADKQINDLDAAIDELTLAEVMGYTYDEATDTWTNENGEQVTGAMSALANKQINELDGAFDELTIAEVMDYTYNEEEDAYYDSEGVKASGIMAALADKKIGELDTSVGLVKIGEIAGFKHVGNTWYEVYDAENPEDSVPASGLLAAFADLTVDEITDEDKLTAKVQTVTVADALGYDLGNDGKYYNNGVQVTGIMAVIAGTQLNSIEDKVNNSYMGDMLGYTYNEENGSWYDGDEKVHVLMQAVSRTKFNNVSSLADTLTIADLIPAENRSEGLMSLVSPTTTLDEMPDEMSRILNETTVGDLINCKAIELDDMSDHDREVFLHYLGDQTLPGFIKWTTDLINKPGFDAFMGADS